jgi:hypothetical protein
MRHRHSGRIIPVLIFICAISAFNQQSNEYGLLHLPIRCTLGLLKVLVVFFKYYKWLTRLIEILLNLTLTSAMCKSLSFQPPKLFGTPGIVKVVLSTIILTRIIYNLKQIHKTKTIFFLFNENKYLWTIL